MLVYITLRGFGACGIDWESARSEIWQQNALCCFVWHTVHSLLCDRNMVAHMHNVHN